MQRSITVARTAVLRLLCIGPGEVGGSPRQHREHEEPLHRRVHEPKSRVQRRARLGGGGGGDGRLVEKPGALTHVWSD